MHVPETEAIVVEGISDVVGISRDIVVKVFGISAIFDLVSALVGLRGLLSRERVVGSRSLKCEYLYEFFRRVYFFQTVETIR